MNVTYDSDRRRDVNDIALFHKQLFGFGTYCLDQRLGQQLFAIQLFNALIEVDTRWQELALSPALSEEKTYKVDQA